MREATDLGISASVRRELAGRRIDLGKIKFPVRAGVVSLQGELSFVGIDKTTEETAVELKFIESGLKMLPGVKSLVFELTNWSKSDSGVWECSSEISSGQTTAPTSSQTLTGEGITCPDCDYVMRFCPCCGKPLGTASSRSSTRPAKRLPPVKPVLKKKKPFAVSPVSQTGPTGPIAPTAPGPIPQVPAEKPAPVPAPQPFTPPASVKEKDTDLPPLTVKADIERPVPIAPVATPQPEITAPVPIETVPVAEPTPAQAPKPESAESIPPAETVPAQTATPTPAAEVKQPETDIFSDLLSTPDPVPQTPPQQHFEPIAEEQGESTAKSDATPFNIDNILDISGPANDISDSSQELNLPEASLPQQNAALPETTEPSKVPDTVNSDMTDPFEDDISSLLPPLKPAQDTQTAPAADPSFDIPSLDETPLPPIKPATPAPDSAAEVPALDEDDTPLPPVKPQLADTPSQPQTSTDSPDPFADAFSFEDDDTPLPPMKPKAPDAPAKKDPFAALFSGSDSLSSPSQNSATPGKDPFSNLDLDLDVLEVFPQDNEPPPATPPAPANKPQSSVDDNPFNLDNVIDLDTPPDKGAKSNKEKDPFDLDDFDISKFKL